MNARNKLNVAYVNGSLIIAGFVGAMLESWTTFFLVLVAMTLVNLFDGGIRPKARGE